MIEVTQNPIDPASVYKRINTAGSGSVVVHFGVVKPVAQGKKTGGIKFAPKEGLKDEIAEIEKQMREKWPIDDVLLIRRVGNLTIGDIILAAAVAAETRGAAFDACRHAVESFKKLKQINKQELFE
ncbi:MAG: molybdenum cofactor biosynthesis protein MoaE [Candidatus Abyssobacteria bacterium SURF_5]|uniref:Molybdopterin synthase catalytic subunit n=1 Tax=Abyssobacteria bacterium (strain SURF_5) TaxID=2093360 RepID=A0A3A4PDX3_ABYX5|nr:MAG: molybdenum cofactor biosynthesis protein MoaE [Candidatus Abyssubacteria bacterium SURF_5]